MSGYVFGELAGRPVGSTFASRKEAMYAGLHGNAVKGISGNRHLGCAAICLNGGYDTDEDYGHEVFYTGSGGQDSTKMAAHDQDLNDSDNAALVKSEETGLPIRILRGPKGKREHSPQIGYRYDGLYKVIRHYSHVPSDGHLRWMFHLIQLTLEEADAFTPEENRAANAEAFADHNLGSGADLNDDPPAWVDPFLPDAVSEAALPLGNAAPGQTFVLQQRIIRDTKVAAAIKALYHGICQICGVSLVTRKGNYSEGAHIRPLGKPHHGPDTVDNLLCLCANHHALFDRGGLYFDDDLNVYDHLGNFVSATRVLPSHNIDVNNLRYHRAHHGFDR